MSVAPNRSSSENVVVRLPDGSERTYPRGTTIKQVAESIGKRLGRDAIGGIIDNSDHVVDVNTPLRSDCSLKIVTVKSPEGLEVLRHSASHVLASAVQHLYPGTQVTFGPAIDNGFYYDFDKSGGFQPEDLPKIEAEMQRIIDADLPLQREAVDRQSARELFESLGEHYKREHVDEIPEDEELTLYRHGNWVDLCEGPHVPSTGWIKAFKLTGLAGAYWRGDEHNPMLSRIYGTAFWDKASLDEHLRMLEEAKKRDHRRLGKELDLFFFDPIAPAMPFFTPKGAHLYNTLVEFVRHYYHLLGFGEVITPQIVDAQLYHRSGHYANYKDNMFFAQVDEREFGVKPMNCPGHALVFAHKKHSYRELPVRYADFGRLHRYERSGVTAGLTRVRSFSQDDAHIFCREDQITAEIATQMALIRDIYGHFDMPMRVQFSTRPEKSIGREEGLEQAVREQWDRLWEQAESRLEAAIQSIGLDYDLNPGDGAFYGPKLDCQVRDALGRWHQLGTIQLDFAMPQRFDLNFTNAQDQPERPVMIHRAVLGSLERFIGILIEHCGGDFPVWLAPVQLRVLTVNDSLLEFGEQVAQQCAARGLRVALDRRSEKLGFKIRDAELQKIPFVAVVGNKEQDAGAVSLRARKGGDKGQMPLDQAIQFMLEAAATPEPGPELRARADLRFVL